VNTRHILAPALLAMLTAASAMAQKSEKEGAWFSYRDTYRSMIRFEKYGQPKQFLESRLQVVPREPGVTQDGMRLTLDGKSIHLELPLDPLGRTIFPLLKAAYDDNAELLVNRHEGSVSLVPRVSIAARADGVYDAADLRSACKQMLQYLHYIEDNTHDGKHCTGVAFSYVKDNAGVTVNFRNPGHVPAALPVGDAMPFLEATGNYRVVIYRFADWPEAGQVVTDSVPLAIAAIFD
jgi:hypothetical protein